MRVKDIQIFLNILSNLIRQSHYVKLENVPLTSDTRIL